MIKLWSETIDDDNSVDDYDDGVGDGDDDDDGDF